MASQPIRAISGSGLKPGLQQITGDRFGASRSREILHGSIIGRDGEPIGGGILQDETLDHRISGFSGSSVDHLDAAVALFVAGRAGASVKDKHHSIIGVIRPVGEPTDQFPPRAIGRAGSQGPEVLPRMEDIVAIDQEKRWTIRVHPSSPEKSLVGSRSLRNRSVGGFFRGGLLGGSLLRGSFFRGGSLFRGGFLGSLGSLIGSVGGSLFGDLLRGRLLAERNLGLHGLGFPLEVTLATNALLHLIVLLAHGNKSVRLLRRAALKGKTPVVASGNPALMNPENPWITHSTRIVYENPWIRVSESQVTNPSGGPGIYGVVHFRNRAIGVLPIDDEGHTWLVGQYRYTLDTYEWEIPEGGCPAGESPLEAAKRELREETGLIAAEYRVLFDNLALSNSVSDERATIFVATGLTQAEADPEETEDLKVRRLPLSEAIAMVRRGEITDSISVMALLAVAVDSP